MSVGKIGIFVSNWLFRFMGEKQQNQVVIYCVTDSVYGIDFASRWYMQLLLFRHNPIT